MKADEITEKAMELVRTSHVMTLSTSGKEGPWSAPVYYIYYKSCFYFFSSPRSRHIQDGESARAAASIHASEKTVTSIRGLQMSGTIEHAGMGLTQAAAFKTYLSEFGFLHTIVPKEKKIENIQSLESLFRAKWYSFKPETSFYMDNSLGFGQKTPIVL